MIFQALSIIALWWMPQVQYPDVWEKNIDTGSIALLDTGAGLPSSSGPYGFV